MKVQAAPVGWRPVSIPETVASVSVSAASYGCPKDIRIHPVVIAKLEFGDVKRQVFAADLMVVADDPALHQRPETLDGVRVDGTDNILLLGVVDGSVAVAEIGMDIEVVITLPVVVSEQANLAGNRLIDEATNGPAVHAIDDAGDNVTLALYSTDNSSLALRAAAFVIRVFRSMPVFGRTADIRLIDFHNANELLKIFLRQRRPDAMAHIPSRPVRAETHDPLDLKGAHALLAGQHEVDDAEPLAQVFIRVLKDCARDIGKLIAVRIAAVALPLERTARNRVISGVATMRAGDAMRPAVRHQVSIARRLIREGFFPLLNGHLLDRLRLFAAGHIGSPVSIGDL